MKRYSETDREEEITDVMGDVDCQSHHHKVEAVAKRYQRQRDNVV